ncbi:adenylate cyclase type 2-like isoform X2 [Frieseomelitta varia]|nr:adenylate cyclase type 2-like isoform X2 [Frieseomelitta varia]XP_043514163.1 adenylate cyclase type 2-like isoform X2 [Frieseomelitta varia]XP_043514164.1 adenylate cyclase type 2-like isoform X2 [Frieseomelitta varia]XP_043514165.1 adenylate cyclase type 2-like isoform X2 [Frieseomelitta varia]XP_043514166.1 adenylate cyclase type 2-like isoform X2 [Frieseomelitta varia]XP_043514168.1 adenylate cyclase type 2-like isoform X2 [Frieseomelitta varia]XP_043514169.1 adenylate cyclase type 2-l
MVSIENCIPDVVNTLMSALLCPIIALLFKSKIVARNTYLPVMLSCLIVVLLVVGDLAVPLYYTILYNDDVPPIRPAYATHALLACYVFLPLTENLHAFILGITATICYLATLSLITYRNTFDYSTKIITESIYLACVNGLGLYFRFMNEIVIRRSFLDHRKCVESTLRLNYEKDQEEQLTRSILPQHIAAKIKKEFRDIFKFIEEHKKPPPKGSPHSDLCVETHNNVSILYADVVNFSGLTVTLPVRKLVETLNDLFGSFDEASEKHNVLRIKFLGDCYYCVSGVPTPNSQHAKSCVDLGLDMIKIIKDVRAKVRRESGVDVNMRIGVHSGNIISGILGNNKWQYDVWSRDVVIANKMEQTGKPGKVHVTQQTLDLVNANEYDCVPVESLNDEVLKKYGIRSYLITPSIPDSPTTQNSENNLTVMTPSTPPPCNKHYVKFYLRSSSVNSGSRNSRRFTATINNHVDVFTSSSRRRTHFMDSCLRDYHLMLKAADAEMENAIKKMPLTKGEQWCKWEDMNPIFLTFQQWNWEIPFLKEPDPLFKFYISSAVFVLIFMGLIYLVPALSLSEWHLSTAISYVTAILFLIALMPIAWMHFAWNRYKDPHDEQEGHVPHPHNKLLCFLYQTSIKVVWSAFLRTILYLVITIMLAACAMFDMIFECKNVSELESNNITSSIIEPDAAKFDCVATPWQMTQTCSLAILTSFLFLRLHYILKLIIGTTVVVFYSWNVWVYRSNLFQSGERWNPYLEPRLAHVLSIIFLSFSLHLIDRQAEYLSRLDYLWKRQLTKEQDEAFHTRNANKLLLRNILPEHVAEFYLNMNRTEENEPYHEAHNNVAVMFASLTDVSIDGSNTLADLNEIICEFDKLLFEPYYVYRIEKIKIAGTTYMAACGLEAGRRDSMHSAESEENFNDNVIKVMAQFAVEMMAVLDKLKRKSFYTSKPYRLRIGISHGEVTAGVVGAQKPLYDIWGDAVNMASRMDTTGVPGKIQVTAETAAVLEQQGIKCHLRGETYVKPKGFVTTYFVGIDDNLQLQRTDSIEETSL